MNTELISSPWGRLGGASLLLLLLPVLFLAADSCTDFFRDEFVAGPGRSANKLAVTAILDTDSGRFTLCMAGSLPFGNDPGQPEEYRNGTVTLSEDGQEILRIDGPFAFPADSAGNGIYRKTLTGVSAYAGRTYRLSVDLDGCPSVVSTAVMPDEPVCSYSAPDLSAPVEKRGWIRISSLDATFYTNTNPAVYYRIPVQLTDRRPARDYYSLRLLHYGYPFADGNTCTSLLAGTDNHGLMEDNPDLESKRTLLYTDGYEVLSFDQMVFSDSSFSGASLAFDLLVQEDGFNDYLHGAADPGAQAAIHTDLLVRAISAETFAHYRHLAMQQSGIRLLSEPVAIQTNMEGGYGCFALQNTKRIRVMNVESYE